MNNQTETNARNAKVLAIIIENHAADGVPADVLDAFRAEALESGYDLDTKAGTAWWSDRSILADWHRANNARNAKANTVEFSWDFEDCGEEGLIRSVYVDGLEIDGLGEYAQDNGLAAARRYVKKLAKAAGKVFRETTDAGLARDYARERMINWNQYCR
jgi:hypothetical protein